MQKGENGHAQVKWSNNCVMESIVQFDFQCVRTSKQGISELALVLDNILKKSQNNRELLTILYKLIGKTRDINEGKGEYSLSYMMIFTWYKYFPELAKQALLTFVELYGSWKDFKYLCNYVFENTKDENHSLIQFCVEEMNKQLSKDEVEYSKENKDKNISLVGKWIPRESSDKFGFLYEKLAIHYFPQYISSAKTTESKKKALNKCKMQYRSLCSKLNTYLDTVQIKQTSKNWASINHAKTTSITMTKQRKAFMNINNKNDPDRIQCAENLKIYFDSLIKTGKEIKGKNVGLEMFTKEALRVKDNLEIDILNSQWRDKCNLNGLGSMIAVVDTSGSMWGDPLHAAIALGCCVAENSILGKRVMTFSDEPTWINLENCNNFTSMVNEIVNSCEYAGLNTNFYKALDMILYEIEKNRFPPIFVENLILAIFSDMQIDDNLRGMVKGETKSCRVQWEIMYDGIKQKYADLGMKIYGIPLNPPHILFWNLRKTDGFPTLSTVANCSMMSGYDPTILKSFCELGFDSLKQTTPLNNLIKSLENNRYNSLEKIIQDYVF